MDRTVASLIAIALAARTLVAADVDPVAWQALQQLAAGQTIDITKMNGESLRGSFVRFTDQSISLQGRNQVIAVPRTEVSGVRLRSPKARKYTWIGAAIGAGVGIAVGAAAGERIGNESGGDFANLKPAIIGGSAAIFALVGALIGSAAGSRSKTIYSAK